MLAPVTPLPDYVVRPVLDGPAAVAPAAPFVGALYRDGERLARTESVAETYRALSENPGALAWIALYRPSAEAIEDVAAHFGVHHLIAEDAIKAHQRAKHDLIDGIDFVVLHTARYVDGPDTFEVGEIHIVAGENFVVTIRHCENPNLDGVRQRLEAEPSLLKLGAKAIIYAVMDAVVDRYFPASDGLRDDIDRLEEEVFAGGIADLRPAYHLSREVTVFGGLLRAAEEIMADLDGSFGEQYVPRELKNYFRDVADHLTRLRGRADLMQSTLRDVLSMNLAIIGMQRNEEMKKVSAWAAILFTPTLISGIYGMNFANMPELHWFLGYPLALIIMVVCAIGLFTVFKKKNWI
jgi:magnesium transporter